MKFIEKKKQDEFEFGREGADGTIYVCVKVCVIEKILWIESIL